MNNISDIISSRVALTLTIEGFPINFDRFNMSVMAKFEEEGISYTEIGKKAAEQPVSFGTKLGWALMKPESKNLFNNDIDIFRQAISSDDLGAVISLVNTKIEEAMPTKGTLKNAKAPVETGAK